ncbi:DUF554 domain-containing protein [Parablautia intestinalis]|uniref:DUF554 domain-containing protein n=1 Tax=Parablautia intestinalis TaxID=2320100 RepID=A0A3A9AIT3_9FIRM|nr:DUF554 domain-containing protein [Parablautia intestinalis]RKI91372.1 DUF554 domain-containing protein [Parablautia intestinalis]
MTGLGTIINTAAVAAGGLLGLKLKNGIKKNMQDVMMQACGVATIFIGGSGALSKMLVFQDGRFETQGTMLLIFSLVAGSLLGEWINIEKKMDVLGEKIKKTVKAENDNLFVEGFVNVSLIICVGAMAIVGSIQDGISGDYSLLTAKAILDFVIVVVFAAAFLESFVSNVIVSDLSFVGSVLIFCVGVNIGFGRKFKVGNMLPALIVPIIYNLIWK